MKGFLLWIFLSVFLATGIAQAQVTLYSEAGLDGTIFDGSVNTAGTGVTAGDTAGNDQYKGYVSFYRVGSVPDNVYINSATLGMWLWMCNNTPYTDLGNVLVDYLDYGASLEAADFTIPNNQVGTISTSCTPANAYRTLDVTSSVQDAIDNIKARIQFRVRHSTPTTGDNQTDSSVFLSSDYTGTASDPYLIINYSSTYQLDVSVDGNGTVTAPADAVGDGIDCGADCSGRYIAGALVTLTATPIPGHSVLWTGGPCDGSSSNECDVTMDSDISVAVKFYAFAKIPTLTEWGMIIFSLLLVGGGIMVLRRRQRVAA